jgi:hypothetical protein
MLSNFRSLIYLYPEEQLTKKMLSATSRQVARCAARQQCRAFSSSPAVGAAAEVKKLGVIGAGQMVSSASNFLEILN